MNFGKRHNVFSDIPGLDSSKGERIVKALQRLWAKIELLEQIRISERKSRSKEVQTSSSDEDLSITDVQYKLLVLQLQYARSILRKKLNKCDSNPDGTASENNDNLFDQNDEKTRNYIQLQNFRDAESKVVSQETQTGSSLIEDLTKFEPQGKYQTDAEDSTDTGVKYRDTSRNITSISSKTLPTNTRVVSKPHYHLKLNDVPFILGASSTASHSVVANVQNIIAMMKSHNKALCGPRHQVQRATHIEHDQAAGGDSQDATKMLNELSHDLYKLTLKQEQLVKRLDAAEGKNQSVYPIKAFETIDKGKVIKTGEDNHFASKWPKRVRSNSESSSKLHAEVKSISKAKEKDITRRNAQPKQNASNTRSHSNNLPIMAHRKLLRSLQNFQTHLSEEDISWE